MPDDEEYGIPDYPTAMSLTESTSRFHQDYSDLCFPTGELAKRLTILGDHRGFDRIVVEIEKALAGEISPSGPLCSTVADLAARCARLSRELKLHWTFDADHDWWNASERVAGFSMTILRQRGARKWQVGLVHQDGTRPDYTYGHTDLDVQMRNAPLYAQLAAEEQVRAARSVPF